MTDQHQTVPHSESRIFEGYRILGNVSNHVPCLTRYIHRRRRNFIVTCIGKSFNTYASQQLQLLSVGGTHSSDISCMAVDSYHVYTSAENKIYAWRRGTELKHTYYGAEGEVVALLPFGPNLLAIDTSSRLCMWNISTEEMIFELQLDEGSHILMHPATYVNKVIIGFRNGRIQLWNIHTMELIYTFKGFNTNINAIVQAPAVDVVAICLPETKTIVLHNLKLDRTLFTLKCDEEVTCVNFRTDNVPVLIAGTKNGTLLMWDLEKKEITGQIERAHHAAVSSIQTFPQEPMFVTSSADNSLKVWIFDMPDGSFRLYNTREGHCKSPAKIRFHGNKGFYILSAGNDSKFLMFHLYNETYNRSLRKQNLTCSKAKLIQDYTKMDEDQFPKIIDFTADSVADPSHYSDIAACHENQTAISTWSFNNTAQGDKVLILEKYKKHAKVDVCATCLYLTSCGQFVVAGYDDGTVERFNIQSGLHRKSYGSPAHSNSVRGVIVDRVSSLVVTGGAEGVIKIWDFTTAKQIGKLTLSAGVSFLFVHTLSGMVGGASDDNTVIIIDVYASTVIRRFADLSSAVVAACFSPDGRHVTASTADCIVRTWDLPTASMVDVFRLESIVTSLEYSVNGEYLATAHHDNVGIVLWINKTLFAHVSLMPIPASHEPPLLHLPEVKDELMDSDDDSVELLGEFMSPEQIDENLITLSLLPESRWKNLLKLDIIKMRNKPKEAPKNYEAPFFLSGLTADSNILPEDKPKESEKPLSKMLRNTYYNSKFLTLLKNSETSRQKSEKLMEMLAEMSPTQVDLEIRSLATEEVEEIENLKLFMEFLRDIFESNKFYEAAQAYLALFLKVYGETVRNNDELCHVLKDFGVILDKRDTAMVDQVNSILAFSSFVKSTLFL